MRKTLLSLLTVIALVLPLNFAVGQEANDAERQKIEKIIQEYLIENPEVIETAILELNRRRTLARMLPSIEMYRGYLENDPEAGILGNPDGNVTVVEFFDYRCGFCRRHYGEVQRLVKEDGNIRWVARHYPILDRPNEEPLSLIAARAGEAAQKQGKFKEFHEAMMTREGGLDEARIYQIGESVGMDVTQMKADMNSRLMDKRVKNSLAVGNDIGFTGTPGYIIGNDVVLGAEGFERLKEAVARARSAKLAQAAQ